MEAIGAEELKVFKRVLEKAGRFPKMDFGVFRALTTSRVCPFVIMEVIALNKPFRLAPFEELKVLLAYRDDDYFPSCWHHPGKYLGSEERIEDGVKRVMRVEAGVEVADIYHIAAMNSPLLSRDLEFAGLYVCEVIGEPKLEKGRLEWFSLEEMPANILPSHQVMQERANQWIKFAQWLGPFPHILQEFLYFSSVLEFEGEK